MENNLRKFIAQKLILIIICAGVFGAANLTYGQVSINDELDGLNDEIVDKKAEIDQINAKIEEYRAKVREYSNQTASLLNDISMIENDIAIAELDVQATQVEIEKQELEIQILEENIHQEIAEIDQQKMMIEEMIFALNRRSNIGVLEVIFGSDNFNELFQEIEQIESVNADLNKALQATQISKEELEYNKIKQEEQLDELVDLEDELEAELAKLEDQAGAKEQLISETQSSETQYRILMSELRQEQQNITSQIAALQNEIEKKLAEADYMGDPTTMSHPLPGSVITATFHDPTYPFRHLWEHSGIDFAAAYGTPVLAAAPGIVAWTRTGNSYGNYIMIIHEDGFATLYAHLSGFNVVQDQIVSRGQVIGYEGSTGFSTGPHLHFEVRINGIPVDPAAYLVY